MLSVWAATTSYIKFTKLKLCLASEYVEDVVKDLYLSISVTFATSSVIKDLNYVL